MAGEKLKGEEGEGEESQKETSKEQRAFLRGSQLSALKARPQLQEVATGKRCQVPGRPRL